MSMKIFVDDMETMRKLGVRTRLDEFTNQRITSQDIAALKVAVREAPRVMPLRVMLANLLSNLGQALRSFFSAGALNNNVCKRYGHAINQDTWTTLFPECRDCGKTIRSQCELRTALPRVC